MANARLKAEMDSNLAAESTNVKPRALFLSVFGLKGGVAKTTVTFHLAHELASRFGLKVLLYDLDTQRDLTTMCLDKRIRDENGDDSAAFFEKHSQIGQPSTLFEQMTQYEANRAIPGFQGALPATAIELELHGPGKDGPGKLFLVPGHNQLYQFDSKIAVRESFCASNINETSNTLSGAADHAMQKTAKKYDADVVLIDMNPNRNDLNRCVFMCLDYFIVPTALTRSPFESLEELQDALISTDEGAENWVAVMDRIRDSTKNTHAPLPEHLPKFLGTIICGYKVNVNGKVVNGVAQEVIPKNANCWKTKIVCKSAAMGRALENHHTMVKTGSRRVDRKDRPMAISSSTLARLNRTRLIGMVKEFHQLVHISEHWCKPVHQLSRAADGSSGDFVTYQEKDGEMEPMSPISIPGPVNSVGLFGEIFHHFACTVVMLMQEDRREFAQSSSLSSSSGVQHWPNLPAPPSFVEEKTLRKRQRKDPPSPPPPLPMAINFNSLIQEVKADVIRNERRSADLRRKLAELQTERASLPVAPRPLASVAGSASESSSSKSSKSAKTSKHSSPSGPSDPPPSPDKKDGKNK